MINIFLRIFVTIAVWPFAAWLFNSFDLLRGIPLNSVDYRAEQAMIAWPMVVMGLLLGRTSEPFWAFVITGAVTGLVLHVLAAARFIVMNPALALLAMIGAGILAVTFEVLTHTEPRR